MELRPAPASSWRPHLLIALLLGGLPGAATAGEASTGSGEKPGLAGGAPAAESAAAGSGEESASLLPGRTHALKQLIHNLEILRRAASPRAALATRLGGELEALRAELRLEREALARGREELKALEERIEQGERRRRELVTRIEAITIAMALLEKSLPGAEVLASVSARPAASDAMIDSGAFPPEAQARSKELFRKSVEPLFAASCLRCHGEKRQKSELDLRSREALLKGGIQGPAIVPGKPQESLLWLAISHAKEPHMPPDGVLEPAAVEAVREWIATGACWESAPSRLE
jgi:hypothetical protein